jgi:hypothetical protein
MNKVFTSQAGFQCTSLKKNVALNFAKPPEKKEDLDKQEEKSQKNFVSVLLEIELKTNKNFFIYDENTHAFPYEKEVLLQEGLEFKIKKKNKMKHNDGWNYIEVHLQY